MPMQNYRFRVVLIVAIIAVTLISVAGVVALVLHDAKNSTPAMTSLLGFSATIIVSLFTLLGVNKGGEEIKEAVNRTNEEAKARTEKTQDKIDEIKRQIDLTAGGEIIAIPALPTSKEQLQDIINEAVRRACGDPKTVADSNKELHNIKHEIRGLSQRLQGQSDLFKSLDEECLRLELLKESLETEIKGLKQKKDEGGSNAGIHI